jgi:hypothetical protein
MARLGRIRTTTTVAGSPFRAPLRPPPVDVIVPAKTLLEVEDDDGAVVGTVELQDLLTDLRERLAALEALAKVKPGDTPEVKKLKKQFSDVAKGRQKGNERSAEARGKSKKRWQTELGAYIRTMRAKEPDLTKDEIITRVIDTWPFKFKRVGRSTLHKAKALWE